MRSNVAAPRAFRSHLGVVAAMLSAILCAGSIPSAARAGPVGAAPVRELKVHVCQANNDSPYGFVRAAFDPGELTDPWAVRFVDAAGAEVPYFVWDSVTWRVAREGREDWGHRFALINHAPGEAPDAVAARGRKLQWAKQSLPALGAKLEARDRAAAASPDSVCAAIYLLRHKTPAFGKERLTLRLFADAQITPQRRRWSGTTVEQRIVVEQGELSIRGLPDAAAVAWKGKDRFRFAGFDAAGVSGATSHADPRRAYTVDETAGIITKVQVTGQTDGRNGAPMDWQCTYWLFPEGGYVGLEGYSLADPAGYKGGPQKLSVWKAAAGFTESHKPSWDAPWWLHQAGPGSFVSTHLLYAVPLACGYANNPFTINAEGNGREPDVEAAGNRLTLGWTYQLNDPAIARVQSPEPAPRRGMPMDGPKPAAVDWKPKVDWLYRQYLAGVGDTAEASEGALRNVLGAAAGWVDRPFDEEAVASTIVEIVKKMPVEQSGTEFDQLIVAAMMANGDAAAARNYLARARNQAEKADFYIETIRESVARGVKPAGGSKVDPDGVRREGFTGNPCYFAHLLPAYLRVFDFFELPYPKEQYRLALGRFADFNLELLGGRPFDLAKWDATLQEQWPSRVVPVIPLMIGAAADWPDRRYPKAATIIFDDLMRLVERNPHGYFPVWSFRPGADRWDTVYNPVSYSRGISSFWTEEKLDWIGRERASKFAAAQVRWMVFSGQLQDTLETDNVCAIRAATHRGHTNSRTQIALYLYDDFEFYRGLIGGVVDWSAATWQSPEPLFPVGTGPYRSLTIETPTLRWAFDIRPGGKWLEHRVQPLPDQRGFKLLAWNRLAGAKPAVTLTGADVGLKTADEAVRVELAGPSYRAPAEFSFARDGDKVVCKFSKSATVRLHPRVIWPDWPAGSKPTLRRRGGAGRVEVVANLSNAGDDVLEWTAEPGEYELSGR